MQKAPCINYLLTCLKNIERISKLFLQMIRYKHFRLCKSSGFCCNYCCRVKAAMGDTMSVAVPNETSFTDWEKCRFGLNCVNPIEPIYDRLGGLSWEMFSRLCIMTAASIPVSPLASCPCLESYLLTKWSVFPKPLTLN